MKIESIIEAEVLKTYEIKIQDEIERIVGWRIESLIEYMDNWHKHEYTQQDVKTKESMLYHVDKIKDMINFYYEVSNVKTYTELLTIEIDDGYFKLPVE